MPDTGIFLFDMYTCPQLCASCYYTIGGGS